LISGNRKILKRDELAGVIQGLKARGLRIGFTNGCFDILHLGHIRYLRKAREECDILILGLNSDRSVRSLKGPKRPVNGEGARAEIMAELSCVDIVVVFDEDTPLELIKSVMPDVIFKGGDWKEDEIAGAREVKENGGRVVRIPYEDGYSTTGIIDKMRGHEER